MNNSLFFNDKEILLVSCYDIIMKLSKFNELTLSGMGSESKKNAHINRDFFSNIQTRSFDRKQVK